MSKRKREADRLPDTIPITTNEQNTLQQRKYVDSVLERSNQILSQALKLARGFERQKLGRRQKAAKVAKDDGESKRLLDEVAALKALDMDVTAEKYLYKSMLKTPSITACPTLPPYVHSRFDEKFESFGPAQTNVQARLFSSQPVKKAIDDCMNNIRTSLGINGEQSEKRRRIRKADYLKGSDGRVAEAPSRSVNRDNQESDAFSTSVQLQVTRTPVVDADQDSDTDVSLDYESYGSRLGEVSDDISKSGSEELDYDNLRARIASSPRRDLSVSLSPHPTDSLVATKTRALHDKGPPGRAAANTKATTFLPSLNMGGYWSGSEQGNEDEEYSDHQTRKNRRGQRERRLIAEKKYGLKASHLTKQRPGRNRDQGWDARKGAQPDEGRGKRGRGRGSGGRTQMSQQPPPSRDGPTSSTGANSDPIGKRKHAGKGKPADGPLHPSWQAAKVAKEQKNAATFQGKKVTFD
ncbi:MAG: hypothetical protein Q9202_007517 [Teloschistes flavicans]